MVIMLLLLSLLGGIAGVGLALHWELGWPMTLGLYVLGGMIGCMSSIAIAVIKSDKITLVQNRESQSVTSEAKVSEHSAMTSFPPCQTFDRVG